MSVSTDRTLSIRPPYDPELAVALANFPEMFGSETGPMSVAQMRAMLAAGRPAMSDLTLGGTVQVREERIPGAAGSPDITVLVMAPAHFAGPRPAVYHIHGGAMVAGDRYMSAAMLAEWVAALDVVVVSVEYRLAPEHPHPAPIDDCYTGLEWLAQNAENLDVDPHRLIVFGSSAGGGLAAATALLARDRNGPALSHQILSCPMLDDRMATPSTHMPDPDSAGFRQSIGTAWTALLGDAAGTAEASVYAAPARALDLAGLPPAYIDVGGSEIFRDEAIDYGRRLSDAGVPVELHVWPGGFHGFNSLVPHAGVSQAANDARLTYLKRVLL